MREFFHGWRRKAGCLTLVMACVVCGMWLRTACASDELWVPTGGEDLYAFRSMDGRIVIEKTPWGRKGGWANFRSGDNCSVEALHLGEVKWHWEWNGFAFGEFEYMGCTLFTIPYWSITLPLTLLSAYLILWKPRKRKTSEQLTNPNLISN